MDDLGVIFNKSFEEQEKISKQITQVIESKITKSLNGIICYDGLMTGPFQNLPYVEVIPNDNGEEKRKALEQIYNIAEEYGVEDDFAAIVNAKLKNDVNAQLFTKMIKCDTIKSVGSFTREMVSDLNTHFGIDVVQKVTSQLIDELCIMFINDALSKIKQLGKKYADSLGYGPIQVCPNTTEMNTIFDKKILKYVHLIDYAQLSDCYIITNALLGTYIEDMDNFVKDKKGSELNGVYMIGIYHEMKVFVDPYMRNDDITVTIGNVSKKTDIGMHYGIYRGDINELTNTSYSNSKIQMSLKGYVTDLGQYSNPCITLTFDISNNNKVNDTKTETQCTVNIITEIDDLLI